MTRDRDSRTIEFGAVVDLHCNTGGHDPERAWSLSIADDRAGVRVIEVTFTHEQLAHMLANRPIGHVYDNDPTSLAVPARLFVNDRIGKTEEHARVELPIARVEPWERRHTILAAFMVHREAPSGGTWADDGWEPDTLPERPNPHQFTDDGTHYRTMLRRWI